jgi:Spy/CpxP family protein refolding chaperone
MKPIKITAATLFLMLTISLASHAGSPTAPAAPDEPMNMQKGMGMHRGMGMGGQMTEAERDQHLRMYQEHMLKMHDLSNRILSETDEKKKDQLKNEQLELMKAHHEQMRTQRMERRQQHQKTDKPATKSTP